MLHTLLGLDELADLESHPKLGASWEGYVVEQVLAATGDRNAYFWSMQSRAEVDLVLVRKGKRWGIEAKYADVPSATKSMHIALHDLGLEKIWVIHPGGDRYRLHEKIECCGLRHLPAVRDELGGG